MKLSVPIGRYARRRDDRSDELRLPYHERPGEDPFAFMGDAHPFGRGPL